MPRTAIGPNETQGDPVFRFLRFGAFTVALSIALACAGAPAGTGNPTATPVGQTPGATQPGATATAVPTIGATAPPVGGHECDAFPTINPASPVIPSFAPDPVLESKFPAEIDGEPVTDLQSGSYLQSLCFSGQATVDRIRGQAAFDLLTMTVGSAKATVDGEEVSLSAFRAPGQDASNIIRVLIAVAAQSGGEPAPSLIPATVGGKNVLTTVDDDGDGVNSYGYGNGDTLFLVDNVTQSQADKIFSALP
jgi:hypothetical protein